MNPIKIQNELKTRMATEGFTPPFCPHPQCVNRFNTPTKPFACFGSFPRKDGSSVRRWRCSQGKESHTFGESAFMLNYWLQKRDLMPRIAHALTEQSSLRGLARDLKVSERCISSQVARLGRHCQLIQEFALTAINPEDLGTLVFDELESWEVCQFTPTTHALFMDQKSSFKLSLQCSAINWKGRRSAEREKQYEDWTKKHGKESKSSSRDLIGDTLKHLKHLYENKKDVVVATDEKKSYAQELKRQWAGVEYTHETYSGKTQREAPPMAKINQEDQYIRQRCSTMRRETLDFMKRTAMTNLRHYIYLIKRNFVMPIGGTKRKETPATRLGIAKKVHDWKDFLTFRIPTTELHLPEFLQKTYRMEHVTKYYENNQTFRPAFVS